MKKLLIIVAAAVLLSPIQAVAQHHPVQPPSELREALARFADAWKRGQFQHLATDLTADFTLLVPAASFQGREMLEAEWPRARANTGSMYLPTNFVRDGDRILETGQAQIISAVAADPLNDDPLCAPDDAGYQSQPARYLREWVRTRGDSWKVKSLVLH